MKISDVQLINFKKICECNDEFISFFTDDELRKNIESVITVQGYWSGTRYRYYLDGDYWRTDGLINCEAVFIFN